MLPLLITQRLRAAAPGSRVLTSPAQLAGYDADGLGYKVFPPDLVVILGFEFSLSLRQALGAWSRGARSRVFLVGE